MSKPVRIRGDVAARVEAVALVERRPFANMVEVLLLAALTERDGPDPERGHMRAGVSQQASAASPSIQRTPSRSVRAARTSYCVHKVPFNKKCEVCDA